MSLVTKNWQRLLQGYLGAWTIALFFGLIVLLLRLFGKIKIKGRKEFQQATKKGGVVIMANHPSLIEAFLLPVILSPRHLFNTHLFFWSLPDGKLFSSEFKRSLFRLGRCIMISRSEGHNYQQIRHLHEILSTGENVVIHPEGGRTMKGTHFTYLNTRRVRKIESRTATLVARMDGFIIPVFIEKEEELAGVYSSLINILTGRQAPMTIHMGESYKPDRRKSHEELNSELEQKILKAGL